MHVMATTTDQVLEAVLYHLSVNGWKQVDIEKLVDVYETFRQRTKRLIYGSLLDHGRVRTRDGLLDDIAKLVTNQLAETSVSRVRLTTLALPSAKMLKLNQMLFGTLPVIASEAFPPRA